MSTQINKLAEKQERMEYEKDVDVIPLDKRELVQAELDAWYKLAGVSWSQTVICKCGRLTTAFLKYQYKGCSVCRGRRQCLEKPTIKCNKCDKVFCRTHEFGLHGDFHDCKQHVGMTEVTE